MTFVYVPQTLLVVTLVWGAALAIAVGTVVRQRTAADRDATVVLLVALVAMVAMVAMVALARSSARDEAPASIGL